jgi:hypothetical protein
MDDATQGTTATATPAPAPAPPPAPTGGGWSAAAQGPAPERDTSLDNAQLPQGPQPQQQTIATPVQALPAPPPTAKAVRPGGLRGFIDKMTDSLAGTDTSKVRSDPDGNLYIQHSTPTRGQQWLKIAVEALAGAGAGGAQRGAGSQGAALNAGINAGQKMKQQQTEDQKNQMLQVANSQALKHQQVADAFEMTRKGVDAAQHDIEFSQKQEDRYKANGGEMIGHVRNLSEMAQLMRDTPNFAKDQAQKDVFEPVQQFTPDGKADGFQVYRMHPGWGDEMSPPGTTFHTFNPVTHKLEEQKTTDWMSKKEINGYELSAGAQSQKYNLDQATIDEKEANAKKATEGPQETPSTTALHRAETGRDYSEVALNDAKRDQVKKGALLADGTPNPRFELMANAVMNGDILPADLKREAKGAGLDPNELIGRATELAAANGQKFSLPIIEQENAFAKSPKTQAALDGIDRVLGAPGQPGYMDQMLDLAKKADLGTNGAWNSSSLAVSRFFGNAAAKNFQTSVAETRRSIAGLIGNPLLGGGETDKKLQQADEMLGQNPTVENLEGAAKVLKQALTTQRNSIVGNNRYLKMRYGSAGAQAQQPQQRPAPAAQAQPANLTNLHTNPQTGQTIGWNGTAYVDTTTGLVVK